MNATELRQHSFGLGIPSVLQAASPNFRQVLAVVYTILAEREFRVVGRVVSAMRRFLRVHAKPRMPTPCAFKLAPAVNGAKKPKSPAHAARRASGIAREASLDDSQLRRPPMIRVDSLTSVRTDGPSP